MTKYIEDLISKAKQVSTVHLLMFLMFTTMMTLIISSQNFFFQKVIQNGISRRDIVAEKTITVIDTKRTEQHRKDVALNVEPILIPAEDEFIKANLSTLEASIVKIRQKNIDESIKRKELTLLFDISEIHKKEYLSNYLLNVSANDLQKTFDKTKITLNSVLNQGITESEYENSNLDKIIFKHIPQNTPRNQITVITSLLKEIIAPNLVVDDLATEIAKKNAQNAIKPYEVVFHKGDKIVFEGEPVTKLKKDALREAGYNVFEINYLGILGIFLIVSFVNFIFLEYMKIFEKNYFNTQYLTITAFMAMLQAI